jgi:hypothetical protein
MLAGEQHIQEDTERVDVGSGRHLAAGELLGGGVLRRQRLSHFAGERTAVGRARRIPLGIRVDQLRNPEVEQLDVTVDADQHVARLDVAMDDQVGVRVSDGLEHVEEQAQPRLDAQRARVAILVDGLAVDVLENEIGLPGLRDARVDQMRDAWVSEPREERAFAPEPLFAGAIDQRDVQELDRGLTFEAAVTAVGEPDAAAAALSNHRNESVGTEHLPRE